MMIRNFCRILIIVIVAGCQVQQLPRGKMSHIITGVWDVRTIDSDQKPDSVIIPAFQKMWHTMLINANIMFFPDQTFHATLGDRDYQGRWEFTKDKNLLLSEKAVNNLYRVTLLSDDEILLETDRNNQQYKIWLKRRPGTSQ